MDTEWSKPTKYVVSIGLVIFGLYVLYLSRAVLTFVIMAALIAFLLMPLIKFLCERLKFPRIAAVLVAYFFLIVLILLSPLILLPPVVSGFNELADVEYNALFDAALKWVIETVHYLNDIETQFLGFPIDFKLVTEPILRLLEGGDSSFLQLPSLNTVMNSARTALTLTVGVAANLAGSVFSGVFGIILTLFFSIYISLEAHTYRRALIRVVPGAYQPEISTLLTRLTRIWRAYFRGQLQLMLIIGVFTWIAGVIIGLPNVSTLAVLAGVMELIPNLGPFLAAIPAILLALIQGSTYLPVSNLIFALIVLGCYVLIQQIENNFIVPRVLGEAVELPALVVMIGVIVGASVAGILGALLAAPVIASTREIVGYLYAKILGQPPFPPQPETAHPARPGWSEQALMLVTKGRQWLGHKPAPADSEASAEN